VLLHYDVCFTLESWSKDPIYSEVIEDVEGLLNDRLYEISLTLKSQKNGEVRKSSPVVTSFRTSKLLLS